MKNAILIRMILFISLYFGLRFFGGELGYKILYPIAQLVTFLHEFGHALGAIITGGSVDAIQINQDGSGFTRTIGGSRAVILMGGYLGSAILGNLLFFIGAKRPQASNWVLKALAVIMIFTGIIWFNSIFTTILLVAFAIVLFYIAKSRIGREVLMFLGLACILYIIQDFNVGPSSDLQAYADIFVVIPTKVWMYIWLFIALILTFFNLRIIFRGKEVTSDGQLEQIS